VDKTKCPVGERLKSKMEAERAVRGARSKSSGTSGKGTAPEVGDATIGGVRIWINLVELLLLFFGKGLECRSTADAVGD
jgi:hypothetical protein